MNEDDDLDEFFELLQDVLATIQPVMQRAAAAGLITPVEQAQIAITQANLLAWAIRGCERRGLTGIADIVRAAAVEAGLA